MCVCVCNILYLRLLTHVLSEGASSIAYGMATEIGQLVFNRDSTVDNTTYDYTVMTSLRHCVIAS